MKVFAFLLFIVTLACGDTILKIATYNVENLFDLKKDGHEYTEYIPNTISKWNQKNYNIKLKNISRVIKDINADIIAFQEIESLNALKDLRFQLKRDGAYYQYYKIANKKNTTVKVALLSKIPFIYTKEIYVTSSYKYRNILEAKFNIDGNDLYVFVNHWKSKAGPESMRIVSAKKLLHRIKEIGKDKNIILLGDFNSDYEEYKIFKRKRKHNDTNGKTGINHVLHTLHQIDKASKTTYEADSLYNLWYDTAKKNRYSYLFRGRKEALDNIIISQPLLRKDGISYIYDSMDTFKPSYLFKGKNLYRWQTTRKKPHKHKGKGFSDHLAVVAKFIVE